MNIQRTYENFPAWIVFLSNLVSVLIYLSGFFIILSLNLIVAISYVIFILVLEVRLLKSHCVNCFYWGRTCGFGKGKVSAIFFKKGNPAKFCIKEFTWKDMIPDLLVFLIPFLISIVLLITRFNLILLVAAIALTGLTTMGNAYIRGNLTCKFCKQKDMGCPAEQLFMKKTDRQVQL